jgi:uncharacterized membrane protein
MDTRVGAYSERSVHAGRPAVLCAPDQLRNGQLSWTSVVVLRVRLRHRQPAQVFILFPVAVLLLLGMVALAIDGGRLFFGRQEMQNAAEAAALDGALAAALCSVSDPSLCPSADPASDNAVVRQAVSDSLARNFHTAGTTCQPPSSPTSIVAYQGETIVNSTPPNTPVNGVYVHLTCTAQFTIAAIIPGVQNLVLSADAVAVLGSNGGAGRFVPYSGSHPYPMVLAVPTS